MLRRFFTVFAIVCMVQSAAVYAQCRTISGLRVDSAERVAQLQDVCQVTETGLGIFTEGIEQINLPKLEYVRTLNIEAFGLKAIALPNLKKVDYLYISGGELEAVELPHLRHATKIFVQSRRLRFINLPELGRVGSLTLMSNPSLEFVFADSLYHIGALRIENNPALNPGTTAVLNSVAYVMSDEEREAIAQAQEDIREYKRMLFEHRLNQPPPPPTGHSTSFDSFGFNSPTRYYRDYNDNYWRYWSVIGPWGYHFFYML